MKSNKKQILGSKKSDDFETYINAIDNSGYESDHADFTGWLYKSNTPEFKKGKDLNMVNVQTLHEILVNI